MERPIQSTHEAAEPLCYSREETERLIQKRLLRERKNNEQLQALRELLTELRKNPAFQMLSNAQIVARLTEAAAAIQAMKDRPAPARADENERENAPDAENVRKVFTDGQDENKTDAKIGNDSTFEAVSSSESEANGDSELPFESAPTFDGAPTIDSAPTFESEPIAEEGRGESEEAAKMRRHREIEEFIARYGEDRLLSVFCDEAFRRFCLGKSGSPTELYEQYLGFLTALRAGDEVRFARAAESRLASTGFSGSSSSAVDYAGLLTEDQKQLAQSAGLSYRRYAELLGQIPAQRRLGRK